jgi:hypothetical protein
MGHDGWRVHVVTRREGNREPHEFAPLAGAYLPRSRARGPDKPHEPSGLRVPRLRTPGPRRHRTRPQTNGTRDSRSHPCADLGTGRPTQQEPV